MSRWLDGTLSTSAIVVALTTLLAGGLARAATGGDPLALSHSGYLLDGGDLPLDGTHQLAFSIHDASGTSQWSATCSVAITKGYYSVVLGKAPCGPTAPNTSDPSTLDTNDLPAAGAWLQLVIGNVTLSPRIAITLAPLAALANRALDAEKLGGYTVANLARAGTLSNDKWCTATSDGSGGTVVSCTANAPVLTESDPKVGSIGTSGKWCTSNGTQITCTSDTPTGGTTQLSTNTSACDPSLAGGLRWNSGYAQLCTGASWVTLSVLPPPTITSMSPATGNEAGGTTVTITGTGFREAVKVYIGGVLATVSLSGSTTITVTTPSGSLGAKDVVVENVDHLSATLAGGFTYVEPPACIDNTSGLLGLWHLDSSATDSSGRNEHGTLLGGLVCTAAGKFGTGCAFDGTDDRIQLRPHGAADILPGNNFTITAWVNYVPKTVDPTHNHGIAGAGGRQQFMITPEGKLGYSEYPYYYAGANGGGLFSSIMTAGAWHHVAVTKSSTSGLTLYVDGVQAGTHAGNTGDWYTNNEGYGLGWTGNPGYFYWFFNGSLDEVAIFNRALAGSEVAALGTANSPLCDAP